MGIELRNFLVGYYLESKRMATILGNKNDNKSLAHLGTFLETSARTERASEKQVTGAVMATPLHTVSTHGAES